MAETRDAPTGRVLRWAGLVKQSRSIEELALKIDALIARAPSPADGR